MPWSSPAAPISIPGRAVDLVLLFGVTYVLERALAEIYNTFLRLEDLGQADGIRTAANDALTGSRFRAVQLRLWRRRNFDATLLG